MPVILALVRLHQKNNYAFKARQCYIVDLSLSPKMTTNNTGTWLALAYESILRVPLYLSYDVLFSMEQSYIFNRYMVYNGSV